MAAIFITGNSQGLGLGLTRYYLEHEHQVYSLSRSACPIDHPALRSAQQDLAQLEQIGAALDALLPPALDLVILNAGILGRIEDLADTPMEAIREVMDINLWANKVIIDWLIHQPVRVEQLILMSSGASVNGNRGWGAYSISKAALNMLAKLYAHEMPATHITAYAPGLVHTRMQDYLCHEVDTDRFPSVQNLVAAFQTDAMPNPGRAAEIIARSFETCRRYPSGSFVDIRQL